MTADSQEPEEVFQVAIPITQHVETPEIQDQIVTILQRQWLRDICCQELRSQA
jgi:hypothetical protein